MKNQKQQGIESGQIPQSLPSDAALNPNNQGGNDIPNRQIDSQANRMNGGPNQIRGVQQIEMKERRQISVEHTYQQKIVYPSINIVCSPRVFQQKIRTDRISLTRYKDKVYASGCRKSFEELLVPTNYLSKFTQQDGMIYNMRDIRSKQRQQNPVGPIKILICICMYNESRNAINLTLTGIYQNLKHFKKAGFSTGDIGVVLLQDGILKLVSDRKKRTFANGKQSMIQFFKQMDRSQGKQKCDLEERINVVLDQIDNYQRKGMSDFVARNIDFPPSIEKGLSLLYQNMWRPSKTHTKKQLEELKLTQENQTLRLFSCFKHTNGTKLSSHLWFFQGFCRYIEPKYCVLLDVGTKPDQTGLFNLIQGFAQDKNIGGVTGFMSVDSQFKSQEGGQQQQVKQGFLERNLYSVQKAQEYEYIISHFLDKNSESALGFLHVLPGAWSAYRYKALIKSDGYEPNLLQRSYFKMILNPSLQERDYMQANMYLAEDRILSLGIYCQTDCQYTLKYVPNAVAYTDPMKSHKNLMTQRRRWINSSLFAFLYVFRNYYYNVMDSSHNFYRKYITLNISMFVALLSFLNTYLTPSLYFFILYSTVLQLGGYGSVWQHVAKTVSFSYAISFLVAVGGGLTGRSWTDRAQIISYILSFFTFLLVIMVIYNVLFVYLRIADGSLDTNNFVVIALVTMLIINVASSAVVILMHLCTHPIFVWKLFLDSASYMAYQGAYSQVMVAHSFCNVDDVSWGTKGSVGSGGKKKYQVQKVFFVSSWLFYNCLVSAIFIYIDIVVPARTSTNGGSVLIGIAIYGSAFLLFKSLLAVWYHLKWIVFGKCCNQISYDVERKNRVDEYWEKHSRQWIRNHMRSSINGQFDTQVFRR